MVTGIGGGGHGEQIYKALRMSENKYDIIGTDMMSESAGLKLADHAYLVPGASSPEYIPGILELCRKHNVKALFHGSEPELKAFSRDRDLIRKNGIELFINPAHVIETCMDKSATVKFLSNNGFNFPRSVTIRSKADVEQVTFMPVVIKPSIASGGSANTIIAQNKSELEMFCAYMSGIYSEYIVQEYVGTPESEYTVGVLLDMQSNLVNSIAVKRFISSSLGCRLKVKNKTGNTSLGEYLIISSGISQGEIGSFPEVCGPCEKIALALGCTGAVNIQCRLVDGKVYVFEINPRFSGTTSLRAMVGYNEPDLLIRKHILGEKILSRFTYKSGFIMRRLEEVFIEHEFVRGLRGKAIA